MTAAALLVGVLGGVAGRAGAATDPVFNRTLGGPSHALIYPSGADVSPDGGLVVADTGNDQVVKFAADGTEVWRVGSTGGGAGQFSNPRDISIDVAGEIFVADADNERIDVLGSNGGWLRSWGARDSGLVGVALGLGVDPAGTAVFAAAGNRVRGFDAKTGATLRTITGTTACPLGKPRDAAIAPDGTVYVANYSQHDIVAFDAAGACVRRWGTLGGNPDQFRDPYGVVVGHDPVLAADAVYVADSNNERIAEYTLGGQLVTTLGRAGTPTEPGTFTELRRVAVAPDGAVWGVDLWGWRVERFTRGAAGYSYAQTIGTPLPAPTRTAVFHDPHQVAFTAEGDLVVMDTVHHRIVRMRADGSIAGSCGQRGGAGGSFNWPRGIAVDPGTGEWWVADTKQYRIQVVRPDCTVVRVFGHFGNGPDDLYWPFSLAIRASDRRAWVADTYNNRIKVYDVATRAVLATYGRAGSGVGSFRHPSGIAVDPGTGRVLVADTGNNRIVELTDSGGAISVVATYRPGLLAPEGVAVDSAGHIAVADTGHNQLVILARDGTPLSRTSGPDGFTAPASVTFDGRGRLYVSDTGRDRIQRFRPLSG